MKNFRDAFAVFTGRKIAVNRALPGLVNAGFTAALRANHHHPDNQMNPELLAAENAAHKGLVEKQKKINAYLGTLPGLFANMAVLISDLKQAAAPRGAEKAEYEARIAALTASRDELAGLIGEGETLTEASDRADDTLTVPGEPQNPNNPPVTSDPANPPVIPTPTPNPEVPENPPFSNPAEIPPVVPNGDGTVTDPTTGEIMPGDGTNTPTSPATGDPVVSGTEAFPAHPEATDSPDNPANSPTWPDKSVTGEAPAAPDAAPETITADLTETSKAGTRRKS